MRLFFAVLLFALAIVGAEFTISKAFAFDPWNVRHYPGSTTTSSPTVNKVGATGTYTWQAIDQYGWADWRNVVARSLNTGSDDSDSLGNVYNRFLAAENRGQIVIREAGPGEVPDGRHFGVSSAVMEAKCGAAWATACVFLLNPLPVPAYYKVASMMTWRYADAAAVVRHETNHALARACDQYRGGCPRASDGVWESQVICTGNPDSLMDCGGAARTATYFDYITFVTAYPATTGFLQVQQPVECQSVGWDPCGGVWRFEDGWAYRPDDGTWFNPHGWPEWTACNSDGLRWNIHYRAWVVPGSNLYDPERGFWSYAGAC